MRLFDDPSRCPGCRERVSPFAAGLAFYRDNQPDDPDWIDPVVAGRAYYLIPRRDLAIHRSDRVALVMQSH